MPSLSVEEVVMVGNAAELLQNSPLTENQLQILMKAAARALEVRKAKSFKSLTESDLQQILRLDIHNTASARHTHHPTLRLPDVTEFPSIPPSDQLKFQLGRLDRNWSWASEQGRRATIDAILGEALDVCNGWRAENPDEEPGSNGRTIRAYPQAWVKYPGVQGRVDYLLGHVKTEKLERAHIDGLMCAVEAKLDWPAGAWMQAVGSGGAVLRIRQKQGKSGPVFVILTNADSWQFFLIDDAGRTYSSGKPIQISPDETDPNLEIVLRWCRWFITAVIDIRPRTSLHDLFASFRGKMRQQVESHLFRMEGTLRKPESIPAYPQTTSNTAPLSPSSDTTDTSLSPLSSNGEKSDPEYLMDVDVREETGSEFSG
ncbi:hypothetical protein HK097_004684 [Rhizophlyctis rosea]|uniref:Uncharacterized protein n=1 Tax=Rhizophlyctis rosea TaxID=64517 RepID=A0AAD5S2T6_9FUNG|nr:hypothetical protein HK097_004684 [Rhizophlyctis rosea]